MVYLYTAAPSGRWRVMLRGRDVVDGRLHAWIERDASGRYQSRFPRAQATSRYTTNTICNCFRAIAVGAYDGTRTDRPPTRFTSRGPTADGRQKPEIAAPGYRILAARSMPRNGWQAGERRLCVKSGTSMAAPWVSGTVALMLAAAGRPLSIHEIRRALIGASDPHPGPSGRSSTQLGYGYLNTAAAVAAARRLGQMPAPALPAQVAARAPLAPVREDLELEPGGWAPLWVEDAAEVAERDEVPAEEPAVEDAPELVAPIELSAIASPEDCGCGGRKVRAPAEDCGCGGGAKPTPVEDCGCGGGRTETEVEADAWLDADEDVDTADVFAEAELDEGETHRPFGAWDGSIETPFEWEDVREALATLETDEA